VGSVFYLSGCSCDFVVVCCSVLGPIQTVHGFLGVLAFYAELQGGQQHVLECSCDVAIVCSFVLHPSKTIHVFLSCSRLLLNLKVASDHRISSWVYYNMGKVPDQEVGLSGLVIEVMRFVRQCLVCFGEGKR
jgi:hypothetical protein